MKKMARNLILKKLKELIEKIIFFLVCFLAEYQTNDQFNSDSISQQVSSVSQDLARTPSKLTNEIDDKLKSPQATPSESNLILKAINKRKLQLACPICSSCVVNMSDHLVKKHSIKDRN